MDLTLSPAQLELQDRARRFVRDVLQPREVEFERANGRVPRDWGNDLRRAAIEANLHGGSFPKELGGQGWSVLEQVLVHEQFGQVTGGLWSYVPGGYNALIHCDAEQRRRYLDPSLRGERSGSYAITEDDAGSDARNLAATAILDGATGEWVLNGEKWFVTGPGRHRLHDLPLRRPGGRGAAADPVPGRLRHAGRARAARPRLHAHLRGPAPAVRPRGRARSGHRSGSGRWARPTS